MDLNKIFNYKDELEKNLTFDEISKLYREILYDKYGELKDSDSIHLYQLLRDIIDIFTQMTKGREFESSYLKNKIKW